MYGKTICSIAGTAAILALAATANAAQGLYLGGKLGVAIPAGSDFSDSGYTLDVDMDSGIAPALALGYDFGNNMRLEGELAYQRNDINSVEVLGIVLSAAGDATATTLGVNGYYDFNNEGALTPFITLGLGVAQVEVNNFETYYTYPVSGDDTVLTYKLGAGLGYAVSEKLNLDITYRYNGFSDPQFGGTSATYSSHNIYLGLRIAL